MSQYRELPTVEVVLVLSYQEKHSLHGYLALLQTLARYSTVCPAREQTLLQTSIISYGFTSIHKKLPFLSIHASFFTASHIAIFFISFRQY